MDPLTQGALGAALPQSICRKRHMTYALVAGCLGGLAPDLDVFIRSDTDPLLFLEYHRQFTHSLVFIPIGGLIIAALLSVALGKRWPIGFLLTWGLCALGYSTHGLLDAMTSYGTMLLWPFSDTRYSFAIVSIVDPLLTVPLLTLVIIAAWRKRRLYARIGFCWVILYLGAGALQHQAALDMGRDLAASRGHQPDRIEVKPSFGNILVWKVIYETNNKFFVDAVRATISPRVFPGANIETLNITRDLPWLNPESQQYRDIERFRWFSDGFIAKDPKIANRIIDIRYSMLPNEISGLWSIQVSADADETRHVTFHTHRRDARAAFKRLWAMLTAQNTSMR